MAAQEYSLSKVAYGRWQILKSGVAIGTLVWYRGIHVVGYRASMRDGRELDRFWDWFIKQPPPAP